MGSYMDKCYINIYDNSYSKFKNCWFRKRKLNFWNWLCSISNCIIIYYCIWYTNCFSTCYEMFRLWFKFILNNMFIWIFYVNTITNNIIMLFLKWIIFMDNYNIWIWKFNIIFNIQFKRVFIYNLIFLEN